MDDGEDHEDSLDNCIPLKKRRLENQSSCENDEKHQLVSEFLFRSAATPSEIAQISDKVKSRIESIYKIISEGGYDAYNTLRSSINKDRCNADSCAPPKHYEDDPKSLEDSIIRGDPRQYQIALFETSKNRNTIVNLETGKGKTLVALLLIRYLSPLFQEGKQTLFLVPSVALAMQHSSTLRANLPYTVATASHNSTRNPGAREAMAAANILVATHGAMLDLFMHYGDLFQMQRINLLVVDECHYARGEHGYAQIMRNFYHPLDSHTRPRVLGLTASPLMSVKHDVSNDELSSQLIQLEEILDSNIMCISHYLENKNVANELIKQEPDERIVFYENNSGLPSFPNHLDIGLHHTREKEFNQFTELYKELGPMVCSIYSNTVARELSRNKYDKETPEQYESAINHLNFISTYCKEISTKCPNGGKSEKVALLEQLLEDIIECKNSKNTIGVVFVEKRITAVALVDYFRTRLKLLKLGKWLRVENTRYSRRAKKQDYQINLDVPIVQSDGFLNLESANIEDMNMKTVVDASIYSVLQDLIPSGLTMRNLAVTEPNEGETSDSETILVENDTIRCDLAVRKCTQLFRNFDRINKEKDLADDEDWLHKPINMEDVLDALKTKRTNVLFATSVVEEGVDISSCSFVIAFDSIKTTKAYVQMKGRARQQNAKFFVFQDPSPISTNQYIDLKVAQATSTRVKQFIESRPQFILPLLEKRLNFQTYEYETHDAENLAVARGEYRTKYALVNLGSAKNLLNRYYLSIPVTDVCILAHVPHFESNRLLLPAHLPSFIRCVEIPGQYKSCRKKEKQSILSLIACVRLHQFCLLNDRLLPLKKRDMQKKLLNFALPSTALPPPSKSVPSHHVVFIYELEQTGKVFDKNRRVLGDDGMSLCFITHSSLPEACLKNRMHFVHHQVGKIHVQIRKIRSTTIEETEWDLCTKFQTVLFNARWRKPNSATFYVYNSEKATNQILSTSAIGCLNKGKEIDWDTMSSIIHEYQRSKEKRIDAVRKHDIKTGLKKPRLWVPTYDTCASYISYGPSGLQCSAPFPEMTNSIQTYADYYKEIKQYPVSNSSLLVSVQHQWYLPGKIRKDTHEPILESQDKNTEITHNDPILVSRDEHRSLCDGLASTLLPLDVFMEAPIAQADLFFLCIFLPQILYCIERYEIASLFIDRCRDHLPILGSFLDRIAVDNFDEILEALTAKSCNLDQNYDRLEWLGDAVLKLVHTDSLLYSNQFYKLVSCLHEGDLSLLRSYLGSNKMLCSVCERIGFDKYILSRPFGRGQWAPSGIESYTIHSNGAHILSDMNQSRPGRKICADVIESLIGLIYIKFSFDAAYDVASELGITLPKGGNFISAAPDYKRNSDLDDAASRFLGGFRFKNPELLEEAITHPSCLHEKVSSYQRLEWVGDAVLCLFARNWIFHKFPNICVGELVAIESSIVCNETLAYICALNKLQVYMNHMDTSLPKKITDYEYSIGPKGRGLWSTDPPKALSDIVEAIIGAVYVDASNTECNRALNHIFKPVLTCLLKAASNIDSGKKTSVSRIVGHPQQYIVDHFGGMIKIKFWREDKYAFIEHKRRCPIWKDGVWGTINNTGSNFICTVDFFDIELFGVEEMSARVARNRACALAIEFFENNPELVLKLHDLMDTIRNDSTKSSDKM